MLASPELISKLLQCCRGSQCKFRVLFDTDKSELADRVGLSDIEERRSQIIYL